MEATEKVRIIKQKKISDLVYYIKLTRLGNFIPGQLLSLSDTPGGTVRYYSIASGIYDNHWGILYNIVDDGWLTPWLSGLKQKDVLYTSLPFGKFQPVISPMVWIGTGTGIAPFHSMLTSKMGENSILIHGAREQKDFYFYDSFLKKLKNRYIPCSSQMVKNGYYPGRLSKYLEKEFSYPDSTYYLCGSSSMVVEMRDLILSKGVDFNKIISEIYF